MATNKNVSSSKSGQRKSAKARPVSQASLDAVDSGEQEAFINRVRERAYFKAQQRGFENGNDLQDWYEAEQEIKAESKPTVVH